MSVNYFLIRTLVLNEDRTLDPPHVGKNPIPMGTGAGEVKNISAKILESWCSYLEMDKEKRIKAEITRLNKIFKEIPKPQFHTAKGLIQNAAFMRVVLADLQAVINAEGICSSYKNGASQYGRKKSPEVETYNVMIKNYATVVKQLTNLLPEPDKKKAHDDGFDSFVGDRDD